MRIEVTKNYFEILSGEFFFNPLKIVGLREPFSDNLFANVLK